MIRYFLFFILSVFTMSAFSKEITLIADPRVLQIPIQENHEKLVDLRNKNWLCIGPSPEVPDNHDYYFVRETVAKKLEMAAHHLPKHIHLCLYEGYRSLALQESLFNHRHALMQRLHPSWNNTQLFNETIRLVSPVRNLDGSENIPPHATGAAVDVYLVSENGTALDLGMHPADWQTEDPDISMTYSNRLSKTARKNREILIDAMQKAGFVNYPTEFWHWSYGDRYWAYVSHHSTAYYGLIQKEK